MTPYKIGASLYLDAGWTGVLPLPPKKKSPPPTGYTGWNGKDPSSKMIETWCNETVGDFQAASNIAIHMPDGVIGVDVDHYGDKTGGATLAQLKQELGSLPDTYISTSRNDGVSGIRWYRVEPGLRWPTGPGKDIEFIHKGHRYAVVWPSVHPSGGQYIWVDQHLGGESPPPDDDQLAWMPDEWQARFTGGLLREDQPEYRAATEAERAQCLTEGEPCKATSNALAKYQDRVVASARHDSMVKTVMALVRLGEQGHRGVMTALKAMHNQFTADVAPDRRDGSEQSEFQRAVNGAVAKVTATPTPDDKKGCCGEHPIRYTTTDDGNALRLVTKHGHQVRRVSDMRKWHHWDGVRWVVDHESRAIREIARDLARQLPEDTKEDQTFKRNSMSSTGISGCVRVAETDPRISVLAAALDAHPELINTPSGVVNLRTGEVKPHDPDLLLTRITAHGVDLDAPHPRFDAFLAETFQKDGKPDHDLISYMQRLAGMALLGNVRDHVLPFLHGVGANGKGVLTLVLQGLLGDADAGGYAVSAPDGFLMAGRDNVHPTEIARLRGARLVVCSEQTSGKRFDESKVKRLTGGDKLTGRFMRGDFFDFLPSHLVWVLSNHLPAVREGGPSFWRRVRKIPFLHVVPDEQQIKDFDQVLLAAEGPAILGWAIRGAVEVLANGLNDPDSVIKATREYEISEDSLASFVAEECQVGPYYWCKVSDFRHRYEQHCEEMGADPLTAKALTMRLTTEHAVTSTKASKGLRVYRGIEFKANAEEQS